MHHLINILKRISLALLMAATLSQLSSAAEVEEILWEDLIPEDYNPDLLYQQYQKDYDIDNLPDDDPKVAELMTKLRAMMQSSPIRQELNDKQVKLPGYVLPLETDGIKATEFLLVPYYGACIHEPPPPLNQTVYVRMKDNQGAKIRRLFDTVWVTGVISSEKVSSELADAGYLITATKVEPFE